MKLFQRWAVAVGAACALGGLGMPAQASVVVSWNTPALGTTLPIGTTLTLSGNANASGQVGGSGLDLALVLDSSGSMAAVESGQSRNAWMKQAVNGLLGALPAATTSVAVVDFDDTARLVTPLTALATGLGTVTAGVNGLDMDGGTNIGSGINLGRMELTGSRHTTGRSQMMVVLSDGDSTGNPPAAAAAAVASGVDAVHAVGLPGHLGPQMQAIATSGKGVYTNVSSLTGLISLFDGTGGSLVGIDRIDLQMNDGTVFTNIAKDGLGNFSSPMATIFAGWNEFIATAYDSSGSSSQATLSLFGGQMAVPEPDGMALLALALAAAGLVRGQAARRR